MDEVVCVGIICGSGVRLSGLGCKVSGVEGVSVCKDVVCKGLEVWQSWSSLVYRAIRG